jgi:DNA-binding response OmpR family regulator
MATDVSHSCSREKDFDLLDLLVTHPGEVLAREVLLEKGWSYEFAGRTAKAGATHWPNVQG